MWCTEERRAGGFTLGELLIALSLLVVAALALISVSVTALRANRKGVLATTAAAVADRELSRVIASAQTDSPPGERARFWGEEFGFPAHPFRSGRTRVGSTRFSYAVYAQTLVGADGDPVGSRASENRLKKVDAVVWWWSENGQREGYGRLEVQASRLVSEQVEVP